MMKKIILSILLILSVGCQCDDSSLGTLSSKLVVSINNVEVTDSFDFGEVTVTKEVFADVTVKNQGETEIVVSSITLEQSGDVFGVDSMDKIEGFSGGKILLQTNSTISFKIYYRPSKAAPPADEGRLVISTNLKDSPERVIKLTGKGIKASIEVVPLVVDFGKVDIYSKVSKEVVVKNTGTDKLKIESVTYLADGNSKDIYLSPDTKSSAELGPGEEIKYTIIYLPSDIGEDRGVLTIKSDARDVPEVDIAVKGEGIAPLIKVEPDTIDFGGVEVNKSSSKDIIVYNNGNKDLIIYKLDFSEISSKYLSVTDPDVEKTLPPQSSTKYTITFSPKDREGAINSKLQIHCNDPQLIDQDEDNHYIAYVTIRSRTPFPKIDVSGAVTIQLGCKSPYDPQDPQCASGCSMDCCCFEYDGFIIKNVGDAPLTIQRIELTNNAGGMLEIQLPRPTPFTLGNNETSKLTIKYKPTDFGQHRGEIEIESNDPNEPIVKVSVVATSFQK